MCSHLLQDRIKRRHSATKRSSLCSIRLLVMRFRRLRPKNCMSSSLHAPSKLASDPLFPRWNRSWRYHKELRVWLTKESGTSTSQKVPGGEHGTYTYWDPENWEKARKEMTVLYADLEEKTLPLFAPGPTLQLSTPQQHQQAQSTQRIAPMQGMTMAAM